MKDSVFVDIYLVGSQIGGSDGRMNSHLIKGYIREKKKAHLLGQCIRSVHVMVGDSTLREEAWV